MTKTVREKSYADFMERLLLKPGSPAARVPVDFRWDEFLKVAKRNVVLLRVCERLKESGIRPPALFIERVEREQLRVQSMLDLARRVRTVCAAEGIDFIFAKAFRHYPDMGVDVDLFVSKSSRDADRALVRELGALRVEKNLLQRIAGATCYRVEGCDSTLDVHHGRMGAYGEHDYVGALIRNGRTVTVDGNEFLVPSPEDQLVMHGMENVYLRSHIRLGNLVNAISLVRNHALNWEYILETSERLGTKYGLACFLAYAEQINARLFEDNLLSFELNAWSSNGWGRIEFRDGCYRFPHVRVRGKAYMSEFGNALFNGRWESAGRLCLAPFAAAKSVLRKLSG